MVKITPDDLAALEGYWQPRNLASQPPDPRKMVTYLQVGRTVAGVRVTPETAIQVSTVFACIDVISKAIASSDWLVYERLPGGDREALPDDAISYLLNVRPNDDMTALSFRRALMIGALSWGNGYAEIGRDMSNRPAALWPIVPDRVEPRRRSPTGELFYEVHNDDGRIVEVEARNMMHIRGPSINGLLGDNQITKAARTIGLAIAQERFAEAYFGNNGQLGGILEYPGQLDDPTYTRLRDQWNDRHQGPNRAHKVAFIEGGMKWHDAKVNADETQLVESRQQQIEEICRWFGVPPHKVQHLLRATFNNIEHLGIEFTRDGLRPWQRELQQEADFKLFSQRGRSRFTIIDLEWASQGDFKSRAEGYQIMRNIGVLSANDILKAEGRNTIGPEGDIHIVNSSAIPLDRVGENMKMDGQEMPETQGDAAREAFASAFGAVFGKLAHRQRQREQDAYAKARDPKKVLQDFAVQQARWLSAQLQPIVARCETVTGRPLMLTASAMAQRVLDGKDPHEAATELVTTYLEDFAP